MTGTTNVAASVKQRLLTLSRRDGIDNQLLLNRYVVERFLYRLGRSPESSRLVLKGAMLFALWTNRPYRATLDVDFTAYGDSDVATVGGQIARICSIAVPDDGVRFDVDSIETGRIREDEAYDGVRVKLNAYMERTTVRLQIDIGFGDAATGVTHVAYPSIAGQPAPAILAYPPETVVAEKVEALVKLGTANSRMKDFFDLWVFARDFEFDGAALRASVEQTFARRVTGVPDDVPVGLTDAFATDRAKQVQWRAFVNRGALVEVPTALRDTVAAVNRFVVPVLEAIGKGRDFTRRWKPGGPWKDAA